jgi:uncharacterized metal-binding protein
MAELVQRAPQAIAIEGCPLRCATEILKRRLPEVPVAVEIASGMYRYDRERQFEIFDMPREELERHALAVAERVRQAHFGAEGAGR